MPRPTIAPAARIIAPLLLLAACATPPPAATPAPPRAEPGMERLLGQPAATALQLLGPPRLDKREGPARQLQFGGHCILDIWYYPGAGAVPVATYADARLADGRKTSPGACFSMLLGARDAAARPQPAHPGHHSKR